MLETILLSSVLFITGIIFGGIVTKQLILKDLKKKANSQQTYKIGKEFYVVKLTKRVALTEKK